MTQGRPRAAFFAWFLPVALLVFAGGGWAAESWLGAGSWLPYLGGWAVAAAAAAVGHRLAGLHRAPAPDEAGQRVLLGTGSRLFIAMAAVVAAQLIDAPWQQPFAMGVVLGYLTFLVAEVFVLLPVLRQNLGPPGREVTPRPNRDDAPPPQADLARSPGESHAP